MGYIHIYIYIYENGFPKIVTYMLSSLAATKFRRSPWFKGSPWSLKDEQRNVLCVGSGHLV